MGYSDLFKPVTTIDTLQLAELMANRHPDDLTLLDVRQPQEYAAGHLPGAKAIPLAELEWRLEEIDRRTTVVVYCAVGLRSRGAAALLDHAGFARVYNLSGGLEAWQGRKAVGGPEEILGLFSHATKAEDHVALAWLLEDGSGRFYRQVGEHLQDQSAISLFQELAKAEDSHVATLIEVYAGLTGQQAQDDFALQALPEGAPSPGELMEGGMRLAEAVDWARGRPLHDILELAIGLETNALDRYLVLHRELSDPDAQRVFEVLADEERRHLRKLIQLFEHFL